MTDEEFDISQEENPFNGQDDYVNFNIKWHDRFVKFSSIIKELENTNLSNSLVECVARNLLTEKDSDFGLHRAIVKPLLKILKSRNMNDLIKDIIVDEINGQFIYWLSGIWGENCFLCNDFDMYHSKNKNEQNYICNNCKKSSLKLVN